MSISSRTRSQNNDEEQITEEQITIRLRSSIRGLEGLIISIPRSEDDDENDDASDFTYVETEVTDESEEDSEKRSINFNKLNKFVLNKINKPCDDCPICLEEFKIRQICRQFDCSHVFHKKCIDKWLTKNVICPVCRACVQPLQPTIRNIRVLRSRRHVRE